MLRRLRPTPAGSAGAALAILLLAALAAACSSNPAPARAQGSARASPTVPAPHIVPTTLPAHPTHAAPVTTNPNARTTTTTGPQSPFPGVIVQAMSSFTPLPAGARAPIRLPAISGYPTAQTSGLGNKDTVTLVATPTPVPVNSTGLLSSQGKELASFSTTPTASPANASSSLAQAAAQQGSCAGGSQPVTLSGGTQATSCPTLNGAAVNWTVGGWKVQVVTLNGQLPSVDEASQVNSTLGSAGLPQSDVPGIVTVQVPGSGSAGSSDTAALAWLAGSDVYQVRSTNNPTAAVEVAAAMRPYPGG